MSGKWEERIIYFSLRIGQINVYSLEASASNIPILNFMHMPVKEDFGNLQ